MATAKILFIFIIVLGFIFYLAAALTALLAALGGKDYKKQTRLFLGMVGTAAICLWIWLLKYIFTIGIPL